MDQSDSDDKRHLLEEIESLRRRLARERYSKYLIEHIDQMAEDYAKDYNVFFREAGLFLQRELEIDGVFIRLFDGSEDSIGIGPNGQELPREIRLFLEQASQVCYYRHAPVSGLDTSILSLKYKRIAKQINSFLVLPIHEGDERNRKIICTFCVFRAQFKKDQAAFAEYSLDRSLFPADDDATYEQVLDVRAQYTDRLRTFNHTDMAEFLTEVIDIAGVDNYLITYCIRKADLEVHLGTDLTNRILTEPDYEKCFKPKLKVVGHLFADIVGFSAHTRRNKDRPEYVIRILNQFLTLAQDIIESYPGSFLDKYIGDCVVALIGALDERILTDENPGQAFGREEEYAVFGVKMGLDLLEAARTVDLELSAGFHVGESVIGFIGPEKTGLFQRPRLDFTAIGDNMNLSARLQDAAGPSELLISEYVYGLIKEESEFEFSEPRTLSLKNMGNETVYGVRYK